MEAAEEVLGLGRVLVLMLETWEGEGEGEEVRLESDPCAAGAKESPNRAVRLLSLPVFFKSMFDGVGRPPDL